MRALLSIPLLLLLSSCTYEVVFPSSHLSILYPDRDTACMPLRFPIMVASFSGGFGFYHEGFGGDVKSVVKAYRQKHPPFAVHIDGKRMFLSDSPIVDLSLEEGFHTVGVSTGHSRRISSSIVVEVASGYPYRLVPVEGYSLDWVDLTGYRDSLMVGGFYVICDSSAMYIPLSGDGLVLLERKGNVRRVDYPDEFVGLSCIDGHAFPVSVYGDSLRAGNRSFPSVEHSGGGVSIFSSGGLALASSGKGLWILRGGRWLRGYLPLRYADIECSPAGVGLVLLGVIPIPFATIRASCHSSNPSVSMHGNFIHVDGMRYRIEGGD